jgi:malic enzyme
VVQFEDFATPKAVPLLEKYRNKYRCFNDDIQGTGCVTLSGIMSAATLAGSSITDMKFLCAGMDFFFVFFVIMIITCGFSMWLTMLLLGVLS